MTRIKKFAKVFFIIDFGIIVFCFLEANYLWLLNTQVAFISSLFISLATFLSYNKNVKKRLEGLNEKMDNLGDRDVIDEIDDPYDLYSDDVINESEKELTAIEIKTILKEEKDRVKRNSLKNTFFSGTAFISIYRIAGYVILVVGFFYLTNNKIFEPVSYLTGLLVVPISVLIAGYLIKKIEVY